MRQPYEKGTSLTILRWLAVLVIASGGLFGQSFKKSKLYIEEDFKLRLRTVIIDLRDDALVATAFAMRSTVVTDTPSPVLKIPYKEITGIEYERSKHRRTKTAVGLFLVHPMFWPAVPIALLTKGKKHWLAVKQGEKEHVFRLDKRNFSKILAAIEAKTGEKVRMIAPRGR